MNESTTGRQLSAALAGARVVWIGLVLLVIALRPGAVASAQTRSSENDAALRAYLKANPAADTDGDGVLTDFERDGHLPRKMLDVFAEDGRHQHADVPMRDGVKLATEIFLPDGGGPWPVVLMRTPYGRWNTGGYAKRYAGEDVAFIVQDLRGVGDSEGKGTFDPLDFSIEINDSYDTVEWIARQPWCNGRVGMTGGSGHGMAAAMAYWSAAPHLVATMPGNTAGDGRRHWLMHNGVRKWSYNWITHRTGSAAAWPRPTIVKPDPQNWRDRALVAAKDNPIVYANSTGWFDPLCQGALDDFAAIAAAGGRAHVTVAPRGHGGISGLRYPNAYSGGGPSLTGLLEGTQDPASVETRLVYYLMGDVRDDSAPGNQWRQTDRWPPAHRPTPLYLSDHRLDPNPQADTGATAYTYDPTDPAPSLGGHYAWSGQLSGPHDQRPLLQRDDVVAFMTDPLEEPLTIVGPVVARLFISSDRPDTLFIAKLIDVYPDGYHALVREGPAMARYGTDPATAAPLRAGEVRELNVALGSTAYAFNTGHRVAVIITSSSQPAYEVHPNTYAPVESIDQARSARNAIHWSPDHPSRIILPVERPQ